MHKPKVPSVVAKSFGDMAMILGNGLFVFGINVRPSLMPLPKALKAAPPIEITIFVCSLGPLLGLCLRVWGQ